MSLIILGLINRRDSMAIGPGVLREQNNHKILNPLLRFSEITKKELAVLSYLSVATVGTILNDFVFKKVIIEKNSLFKIR